MDIPNGMVPPALLWLSWLLFAWVSGWALRRARWTRLRSNEAMHVWLGAMVIAMLVWMMKGGVTPGLGFHILGVTCLTLMFGWAFAWIALSAVVAGTTAYGLGGWEAMAVNCLLMGGIPIMLTQALLQMAQRWLPHNFFIYIFLNAFFAAGFGSLVSKLAVIALIIFSGAGSYAAIAYEYLPYLPLMFLSEALVNGMIMTLLVALRPGWVCSFDDHSYLDDR